MNMKIERKPQVSVIVPVFNVEEWLDRCVKSILRQNFKNYEILLIDDGSTDKSGAICDAYQEKYKKVKAFHKQNGGLSDARNFGINMAQGEYYVFVDSDDFIDKEYISVLYNAIKQYDTDVSMCSCRCCKENGEKIFSFNIAEDKIISGKQLLNNVFDKKNGMVYTVVWTKMYKKQLFSELRFEKGRNYEDEYLNPKLFWNVGKVAVVSKPLYNYVIRQGSITQSNFNIKNICDANNALTSRIEFYNRHGNNYLTRKAIYFYLDWIASTIHSNYKYLKNESRVMEYFQHNYRKYFFKCFTLNPKRIIKGILCSINIKGVIQLYTFVKGK